tara:strand:- start:273 stop:1154 length:882 start_codon:yes stop_codon:yes gene_type:complete
MASNQSGSGNTSKNPGSDLGTSPYQDDVGTTSFNFGGKPPIVYMQFLLGEEIFTLFGDAMLNEAFESSFKHISEIITESVLLENLGNAQMTSVTNNAVINNATFSYEKRILKVLRQNTTAEDTTADVQYYWACRKVTQPLDNNINPHSIYFENDPFSPTWYINTNGGIHILPKDSSAEPVGKVYFLSFPKFGVGKEDDPNITHDLGNTSGFHNFSLIGATDEEEIFIGLPIEAREAVYLAMATNLVFGFLSNHVQDDEDSELVSLLNIQQDFLGKKLQVELERISKQFGAVNE